MLTDSGGVKFDQGKLRTDLLPVDVLEGVSMVLTVGARKYAERNWELGMKWSRPYGALLRHLWAFWRGEEIDAETGLPHIDQVVCNAMFLARYWREKNRLRGIDDRPISTSASTVPTADVDWVGASTDAPEYSILLS